MPPHHQHRFKILFLWFTGIEPRLFRSPRHPSIEITWWESCPPPKIFVPINTYVRRDPLFIYVDETDRYGYVVVE